MSKNKHMKVKRDRLRFTGVVVEAFRSAMFSVKLHVDAADVVVKCTLCGKMKENYIKVVPGDFVDVELCEYDMSKGRIISRTR